MALSSAVDERPRHLWLWILASKTLGKVMSREAVHAIAARPLPPELIERHEFDPFATDSFSGALYLSHLNSLAPLLGPEAMIDIEWCTSRESGDTAPEVSASDR